MSACVCKMCYCMCAIYSSGLKKNETNARRKLAQNTNDLPEVCRNVYG